MGSFGTNPKGQRVILTECPVCGDVWAGSTGHSIAGEASDTERHKVALAARERGSR